MGDLNLRNITPEIEEWLLKIGVENRRQLEKLGAKKTYLLLLDAGHPENQELRQRLIGALEDIDWQIVAERERRRTKSRFADVDEP